MAEGGWIVEGLIQFLTGPYWRHHIDSFIDYNCLVFDTDEENKLPHMEVYKNYQKHVEKILSDFSDNLGGITPEQLATACSEGLLSKDQHIKNLFLPILAVSDFITFKEMMVDRNLQLDEEAMKLGSTMTIDTGTDDSQDIQKSSSSDSSGSESDLLRKALLQSKTDYELSQSREELELQEQIRRAMEESINSYEQEKRRSQLEEGGHTPSMYPSLDGLTPSAPTLEDIICEQPLDQQPVPQPILPAVPIVPSPLVPIVSSPSVPIVPSPSVPIPAVPIVPSLHTSIVLTSVSPTSTHTIPTKTTAVSGANAAAMWLETAKAEHGIDGAPTKESYKTNSPKIVKEVKSDDLKERSIYLKKQRDRLLTIKQQERERELRTHQIDYSKLPDPAMIDKLNL